MNMETEVEKSLISCIVSRQGGVPFHEINEDFKALTGYSIPFLSLGHPTLTSFLTSIKDLYFVKGEKDIDFVIVDSLKSRYMKKLVERQKPHKRKRGFLDYSTDLDYTISSVRSSQRSFYPVKKMKSTILRKKTMNMLTPIMFGCQLIGDDIFVEVAEHHLMVSVEITAPKRCGLCITGQTIKDLIDNIDLQTFLPYRVAILIGLAYLLNDKNSNDMISDMDLLISQLKKRNISATLFTLPKLKCIPKNCYLVLRMFNDYIISQEDATKSINVMNLEQFYAWMMFEERVQSKITESLLHETERIVILFGLKDHLSFMDNEE